MAFKTTMTIEFVATVCPTDNDRKMFEHDLMKDFHPGCAVAVGGYDGEEMVMGKIISAKCSVVTEDILDDEVIRLTGGAS